MEKDSYKQRQERTDVVKYSFSRNRRSVVARFAPLLVVYKKHFVVLLRNKFVN